MAQIIWHTEIPGLWTLAAGPWVLDTGRWTLDSGRWKTFVNWGIQFLILLMSHLFCREYVLTWLVLKP